MMVVAFVTIAFIMVGDINSLAIIVTMPFLLTYACIDYSYFALAQTFDIQSKREERFESKIKKFDFFIKKIIIFRFRIQAQSPSYESRRYGSTTHDFNHENNDLDQLFPERTRHKNLSSPTDTPLHVPVTSSTSTVNQDPSTNNSTIPDVEFRDNTNNDEHEVNEEEPIAPNRPHIHSKTKNWYSGFCNRYASLLGVNNNFSHLIFPVLIFFFSRLLLKF